jgi:ribonuclease HII
MQSELALHSGQGLIAGVDEVGRGPLAGPVVAAAVILDPANPIEGLADSKAMTAKRREALNIEIRQKALCWAIARAEVDEIDELNILHASMLAMQRAVELLAIQPEHAQIDGNRCPSLRCSAEAIVKGDQSVPCISAASIIAKVERDREMIELEMVYPGYGFASHKGYPTRAHMQALAEHGVTPVHRYSFGPVARLMEQD